MFFVCHIKNSCRLLLQGRLHSKINNKSHFFAKSLCYKLRSQLLPHYTELIFDFLYFMFQIQCNNSSIETTNGTTNDDYGCLNDMVIYIIILKNCFIFNDYRDKVALFFIIYLQGQRFCFCFQVCGIGDCYSISFILSNT